MKNAKKMFLESDCQVKATIYKEQGKFNFLGSSATKVIWHPEISDPPSISNFLRASNYQGNMSKKKFNLRRNHAAPGFELTTPTLVCCFLDAR